MSLGKAFQIGTNGLKIPAVGLGTWKSGPGEVANAVKVAIDAGYRHIDCAWAYKNEKEVAEGIKASGIDRDKLFITSKLWNTFHQPEQVQVGYQESLDALKTGPLDLLLMHWPVAFDEGKTSEGKPKINRDLTENPWKTWQAMERLFEEGKVKNIGVSNFTVSKLERLLEKAKVKPVVNQVELNLHCAQPELVAWSKKNGILLEAYSPLGSTGAPQLEDPVVMEIAKNHGTNPANVLISWQVYRGVVCLPKSVTPDRIRSNFQDVELTMEEVTRLEKRGEEFGTRRTVDPEEAWGVKIWDD